MKHDFSKHPQGGDADRFISWLREETVSALKSDHGDLESLKTTLFLYANRAYEAKLAEEQIYTLLAISIVHAGYSDEEEGRVLDIFESFAQIARGVNGYP